MDAEPATPSERDDAPGAVEASAQREGAARVVDAKAVEAPALDAPAVESAPAAEQAQDATESAAGERAQQATGEHADVAPEGEPKKASKQKSARKKSAKKKTHKRPPPKAPDAPLPPELKQEAREAALARLAKLSKGKPDIVRRTIDLLEKGTSIAFLARFRRELTGGLDEGRLCAVRGDWREILHIEERRIAIRTLLAKRGALNDETAAALAKAPSIRLPTCPSWRAAPRWPAVCTCRGWPTPSASPRRRRRWPNSRSPSCAKAKNRVRSTRRSVARATSWPRS
jgi:hypothetical protein